MTTDQPWSYTLNMRTTDGAPIVIDITEAIAKAVHVDKNEDDTYRYRGIADDLAGSGTHSNIDNLVIISASRANDGSLDSHIQYVIDGEAAKWLDRFGLHNAPNRADQA